MNVRRFLSTPRPTMHDTRYDVLLLLRRLGQVETKYGRVDVDNGQHFPETRSRMRGVLSIRICESNTFAED